MDLYSHEHAFIVLALETLSTQNNISNLPPIEELFEQFADRLFAFFMSRTRSRPDSLDLVQEVFENIMKSRSPFEANASTQTWIFSIAHNTFLSSVRSRSTRQNRDRAWHEASVIHNADQETEGLEDQKVLVTKALSDLSDEHVQILTLAKYEQLRYQEIADYLEISESAVKVRVFRALAALREAVKHYTEA